MLIPQGDAIFSGCGRYRYKLTRELGGGFTICFVMLNPSTADGTADDNTLRQCKKFARAWNYGRLSVVNLYAFRATDPRDMWRAHESGIDIIGDSNNTTIVNAATYARQSASTGIVVCAWGKGGATTAKHRAFHADRIDRISKLVGGALYCLGVNGDGSPKHPLYLPEDTEAQIWRGLNN